MSRCRKGCGCKTYEPDMLRVHAARAPEPEEWADMPSEAEIRMWAEESRAIRCWQETGGLYCNCAPEE